MGTKNDASENRKNRWKKIRAGKEQSGKSNTKNTARHEILLRRAA